MRAATKHCGLLPKNESRGPIVCKWVTVIVNDRSYCYGTVNSCALNIAEAYHVVFNRRWFFVEQWRVEKKVIVS